jgi:pSer/pThr/pTyr-binding forkhead associated (FHA) protein
MPIQLVLLRGPSRLRTIPLRAAVTVVGRDAGCAVRLVNSDAIAGRHCQLRLEDGQLSVEDLGSGTTALNGRPVQGKQPVSPGDRLTVGPITFLIEQEANSRAVTERLPEAPDLPVAAPATAAPAAPAEEDDEGSPAILLPEEEEEAAPPVVPLAVERPPSAVAPNEAEAEAEVELADADPGDLPVAEALDDPTAAAALDAASQEGLPDAAPNPTAGETARAVGGRAGRFAGKFTVDVGKGVGKGLVKKALGGLLTDMMFERPKQPADDGGAGDGADEAVVRGSELRPVVRLTCPHCDGPAWTTADRRGSTLLCPHCRRPFGVPRRARVRAPTAYAPRRWRLRRRVVGVLLGGLLTVAGVLWISGWWGPLLWQPAEFLLGRHLPPQAALGVGVTVFALIGYGLLKLRLVHGIPTELDFIPCRPRDFPRLDRGALVRYTRAFEALGFVRALDYTTETDRQRTRRGFGRLFIHPARRCFAEINQIFPAQGPQGRMHGMVLTLFEDGWSLSATDRPQLGAGYMMRRPRALWTTNPKATPAQLLAGHLKRREIIAADLGVEVRDDVTPEAYFENVRAAIAGMRRAVWRKNLLVGMLESMLFDTSPRHEWMGEYARYKQAIGEKKPGRQS